MNPLPRPITDALFMANRDVVKFKRWNGAILPPGIERSGTWNYGHPYIAWHPVETSSALEGVPKVERELGIIS